MLNVFSWFCLGLRGKNGSQETYIFFFLHRAIQHLSIITETIQLAALGDQNTALLSHLNSIYRSLQSNFQVGLNVNGSCPKIFFF